MDSNTKKLKKILHAFEGGDNEKINIIKGEAKLRLNKYAAFNNKIEKGMAYKAAAKEYDMPDGVFMGFAEVIYTKADILYWENFIDNWADGEYDDVDAFKKEFNNLEDFEFDADVCYIFYGFGADADCKLPKPSFTHLYDLIYHIANRKNWKNGICTEKYANGNLCSKGKYLNDTPIGTHKMFSFDGKEEYELIWKDGGPWNGRWTFVDEGFGYYNIGIKNSKRHGKFFILNKDGKNIKKEGSFKDDVKIGTWTEYYEDGTKYRQEEFDDKGDIITTRYWEDGKEFTKEAWEAKMIRRIRTK